MSVSVSKVVLKATCDGHQCTLRLRIEADTQEIAFERLRGAGWWTNGLLPGRTLCPTCRTADRRLNP